MESDNLKIEDQINAIVDYEVLDFDVDNFFLENDTYLYSHLLCESTTNFNQNIIKNLILDKKTRTKLNDKNKKVFLQGVRHILIFKIFKSWKENNLINFLKSTENIDILNKSLNSILFELKLISLSFTVEELNLNSLVSCFYYSPEKLEIQYEKNIMQDLYKRINYIYENDNLKFIESINLFIKKNSLEESLKNLVLYLLSIFKFRTLTNNNEVYESFCLLAEDKQPQVLIVSLDILKKETSTISLENYLNPENILILSLENTPDIKKSFSEKEKIKDLTIKLIDFICEKRPELKNELFSNKYIFTLRPTIPLLEEGLISGNSFTFPFLLLLYSAKMYNFPMLLEYGICSTGEVNIIMKEREEIIQVDEISGISEKSNALKKYNHHSLFGQIKNLYVAEKNEKLFMESLKSLQIQMVSSYYEIKNPNDLYLTPVNNFQEIKFVDTFVDYLEKQINSYKELLKEDIFDDSFNKQFECISEFKNYIISLNDEKIDETTRKNLLTDSDNEFCILDKEGIIIPCFISEDPKTIAEFFCNFLAYNRNKLKFVKIPVPVLIPLNEILEKEKFILEEYLSNIFNKFDIPQSQVYSNYKNPDSFVFIIYELSIDKTENPFRGEKIISTLKDKNYVICCANSIEQANYWLSKTENK